VGRITPVLKQFHWLPVRQRIEFNGLEGAEWSVSAICLADDCQRTPTTSAFHVAIGPRFQDLAHVWVPRSFTVVGTTCLLLHRRHSELTLFGVPPDAQMHFRFADDRGACDCIVLRTPCNSTFTLTLQYVARRQSTAVCFRTHDLMVKIHRLQLRLKLSLRLHTSGSSQRSQNL